MAEGSDSLFVNWRTGNPQQVDNTGIADGAVTSAKLATDSVSTIKIQDDAVTNAKLAEMPANTFKMAVTAGNPIDGTATQARTVLGVREVLTAARTYYVSTTGSNSNDGLTALTPFLTIQYAVTLIATTLDIAAQVVTIQLADGTYTVGASLRNVVGYGTVGNLIIRGNPTTPASTLVSVTSANAFVANGTGAVTWDIYDLEIRCTTAGSALLATNAGRIRFNNIRFGACAGAHVDAQSGGFIQCLSGGSYIVNGGGNFHLVAQDQGTIGVASITVTVSASVSFASGWATLNTLSYVVPALATYVNSLSVTGQKYNINANSVLYVAASVGTLPGTVAGASANGAIYL